MVVRNRQALARRLEVPGGRVKDESANMGAHIRPCRQQNATACHEGQSAVAHSAVPPWLAHIGALSASTAGARKGAQAIDCPVNGGPTERPTRHPARPGAFSRRLWSELARVLARGDSQSMIPSPCGPPLATLSFIAFGGNYTIMAQVYTLGYGLSISPLTVISLPRPAWAPRRPHHVGFWEPGAAHQPKQTA